MNIRLLENYPFKRVGVTIAEGFSAYDGTLGDIAGAPHGGIDYVLNKSGEHASFEVFTMYEGAAQFGVSNSLGKYFIISTVVGDCQYDTVYAHLDNITEDLQKYAIIQGDRDFIIPARYPLGWAGKTGLAHNIRQLHLELYQKNLKTGAKRKLDPYGLYDKLSSGRYRQPGQTLRNLDHYWTTDEPEFIN